MLSFGKICIGQECSVSIYVAQSLSRMGTVMYCILTKTYGGFLKQGYPQIIHFIFGFFMK